MHIQKHATGIIGPTNTLKSPQTNILVLYIPYASVRPLPDIKHFPFCGTKLFIFSTGKGSNRSDSWNRKKESKFRKSFSPQNFTGGRPPHPHSVERYGIVSKP
jgi:hypothetical protein